MARQKYILSAGSVPEKGPGYIEYRGSALWYIEKVSPNGGTFILR